MRFSNINSKDIDIMLAAQNVSKQYNIPTEMVYNRKYLINLYQNLRANKVELKRLQHKLSTKPILKINNNSIVFGSVVKLINQEDYTNTYDKQLKKLIDAGHRFVVGPNFGPKANGVPIHLLSTSIKANVKYKNGCKLYGNYTDHDYVVFLDLNNVWIIKKNCIKSFEYNLINDDKLTLLYSIYDKNFSLSNYKLGVIDSGILQSDFEDYKKLRDLTILSANDELRLQEDKRISKYWLKCNLTYTKIEKDVLLENKDCCLGLDLEKKLYKEINTQYKTLKERENALKEFCDYFVDNMTEKELLQFSDSVKRGYFVE